jgi:hypothetical protein
MAAQTEETLAKLLSFTPGFRVLRARENPLNRFNVSQANK